MKKYFLIIAVFLYVSSALAAGHLSEKDRKATLKCTGLYYANSMIPQGTLELDKIVFSIAAKKYLTSYLISEGMKEDFINKELNKSVDELYGKPYNEKKKILNKEMFYDHFADKSSTNKWESDYKLKLVDEKLLPSFLIDNKNKYKEWFSN